MKITSINDYKDIQQEKETVLVLGYFDALHRGHKVLLIRHARLLMTNSLK